MRMVIERECLNSGECEMSLGDNVKRIRKERGWSQAELADKIGAHLNHVSKIENSKYMPSFDTVQKLAEVLQVSLDYLANSKDGKDGEMKIEDQTFAEKIRLLNSLETEERKAIILFIDALLSKKKMISFAQELANR
jgi:transcriptional regulator with XRE-family HTH domain